MNDDDDFEDRLDELEEKFEDFSERAYVRSALRVSAETARLAKAHSQLVPYMHARFNQMNKAQDGMEPELGQEVAIELIALLESEERARLFQADLAEPEYAETVGWMSACAYDNLATHTAEMNGYNSEGMHACIADGIDVCRRTGKTRCITCFREYASDVYLASDDVTMALHFARMVRSLPEDAPESERRWVGANDEIWIMLLLGDIEAAEVCARRALSLADKYHTPHAARIESTLWLEIVMLLLGKAGEFASEFTPITDGQPVPKGENAVHDLLCDKRTALAHCLDGQFDSAIAILQQWDRKLLERRCLHSWFDVRLRLIAAHRLAGKSEKAEALAKELEEKGWKARDWMSLRRLTRLMDPAENITPLALLGPVSAGPYASNRPAASAETPSVATPETADESSAVPDSPEAATPLDGVLKSLVERMNVLADKESAGEDEVGHTAERAGIRDAILELATVEHPVDAARLLHLMLFLANDEEVGARIWRWAREMTIPFMQHAVVLNLLATLGDLVRTETPPDQEPPVACEGIEAYFRQSMDLDPFDARHHARAGAFFLGEENFGEAERCLARGFRLNRSDSFAALRLAEVYRKTDRPRDGLMVLDTCLREGVEDPDVAWNAALLACDEEQYESLLTYLDRFEQLAPNQPWVNYYRTLAHLELSQADAALRAVQEEENRNADKPWMISLFRACALCAASEAKEDEANDDALPWRPWRAPLKLWLATPLHQVDYLSPKGVSSLCSRLWKFVGAHMKDGDPLRARLVDRLLEAGYAPDEVFEAARQQAKTAKRLKFYRCVIRQPLDSGWSGFAGRLAHQEEWHDYLALWGVLAPNERKASELVTEWQARCYPLPATIQSCEVVGEGYEDKPGVVWQGERWWEPPAEGSETNEE